MHHEKLFTKPLSAVLPESLAAKLRRLLNVSTVGEFVIAAQRIQDKADIVAEASAIIQRSLTTPTETENSAAMKTVLANISDEASKRGFKGTIGINEPLEFPNSEIAELSLAFSVAVVIGDYETAHSMLSSDLQKSVMPEDLRENYASMTSYWTAKADEITLSVLTQGYDPEETGWAYVSIDSNPPDDYANSEAVTLWFRGTESNCRIFRLEWGRP